MQTASSPEFAEETQRSSNLHLEEAAEVIADGEMRLIGRRISQDRVNSAKRSFVTRRIDLSEAAFLAKPKMSPQSGDIILAKVSALGQHSRIELQTGRRARLFIGDEIIVSYAARYAPDQFHADIPAAHGPCDLVAAGGIASEMIDKHRSIKNPTKIIPLGLLIDKVGVPLNVSRSALSPIGLCEETQVGTPTQVIAVVGSCMNAGKTTTAAYIVKCLKRSGLRVAACKVTGTGAGGDYWHMLDSGAHPVLDFTDAGFASTYRLSIGQIQTIMQTLLSHIKTTGPDIVVVEIADGLLQEETEKLVKSEFFKAVTSSIVYAAGDAMSALTGVTMLKSWGYSPAAISGAISESPLACAEAMKVTGLPVLTKEAFLRHDAVSSILMSPAHYSNAGANV